MRLLNFLCAALALGVLGGCASTPQNEPQASAVGSILSQFPQDDLGREIRLSAPAQRVVSIGPGATETIFALGAQSKLVGRDQISDYPAATKDIPLAGDYTGPFVEKVVALKPDLVIVQGETYDRTRAENWQQKIGAPVAILVPTSVDEVENGIRKIAAWLGANEKLAEVTKEFPSQVKAPGYKSARNWSVFYEVERSPLWTAGKETLIDSQLQVLGWKNIAHDVQSYKAFNLEELLKRDPEFYIVPMEKPDRQKAIRDLRSTPALKNLTAVKQGRVLVVDADLVLRPSPRLPEGIQALSLELSKLTERDSIEPGVVKN